MPSVLVHIVTWNSALSVLSCLDAVLAQEGFACGELEVCLTDNASSQNVLSAVRDRFGDRVRLRSNSNNLGFCGAHNQGAKDFLEGKCDFLFILNPDLRLEKDALIKMVHALAQCAQAGSACPKLYRADENLEAVEPRLIDAAGMHMSRSLRHFDCGSNQPDSAKFAENSFVFGASGAALLMKRDFVKDMLIEADKFEDDKLKVYPQLAQAADGRVQLFDEAFFAYREDADLAWRAQLLGWRCLYVASAVGYHERVVLPERRSKLPAILNALGVQNRFLLQLNNYSIWHARQTFFPGFIIRNLVVILAVFVREWSSIAALWRVCLLGRRALRRRAIVFKRRQQRIEEGRIEPRAIGVWFDVERSPYGK